MRAHGRESLSSRVRPDSPGFRSENTVERHRELRGAPVMRSAMWGLREAALETGTGLVLQGWTISFVPH